ncbi:hypothetical protein L208DRAFT_1041701, partial [Tricholoma matsutake]
LCHPCSHSLHGGKLPCAALSNHTFLGDVPEVLQDLTVIEESIIVLVRAKCYIVQLKADNEDVSVPNLQRGMRGHVIMYPQKTSTIAKQLPCLIKDIVTPICVLFIGSSPPTKKWLKEKAKLLTVRADCIRQALVWLKPHN